MQQLIDLIKGIFMAIFGRVSKSRLSTCHPLLQELFEEVVKTFDCTVLCGHRGEQEQMDAFNTGKSKVKWPDGKHNSDPSWAVDVAPYYAHRTPKFDWDELREFSLFAGYVLATAKHLGIQIRWGGNWKQDFDVKNNSFFDGPHFELTSDVRLKVSRSDTTAIFEDRIEALKKENETYLNRLHRVISAAKGDDENI